MLPRHAGTRIWAFDAGASPTESHSYANPGQYHVTLTVTDDLGITGTTSQLVTVDAAPTASFSASTDHTDLAFGFDASKSSDTVGTITDYSWNFGDGATEDTGTTATATHTYANPGTYTISLTTTDDLQVTNTATETVTVVGFTAARNAVCHEL